MTNTSLTAQPHQLNTAGQQAMALASSMVRRIFWYRRAVHNRRSISLRLDWDTRMLEDVGLTRGDVLSAMAGTPSDNSAFRAPAP